MKPPRGSTLPRPTLEQFYALIYEATGDFTARNPMEGAPANFVTVKFSPGDLNHYRIRPGAK
jgi:hypothetical protein